MIASPLLAYIGTEHDSLGATRSLLSRVSSRCVTWGGAHKSDALIWQKESFFLLASSFFSKVQIIKKKCEFWSNTDCLPRTKHYFLLHSKQFLVVGINWLNDLKSRAASICGETLTVVANPAFGSPHQKAK